VVAWVRVAGGLYEDEGRQVGDGFGGGSGSAPGEAVADPAGGGFDPELSSERGDGRQAGDVGIPLTWCDWEPSLLLDIPESWPPGLYVARFTVDAPLLSVVAMRGRSAYVPFVVRGPLAAGFPTLVVLPFAAYTAANPWPVADVRRARALSFDRPFAGNGLPTGFAADAAFVEPLTATDFATSLDLHAGLVDPGAYRKVLLRTDLWSLRMRAAVARASLSGTDVGGLDGVPPPSVDFAPGPDGRDNRILIRY
uniref:N,N-dimethylformamidase beta subunit family domain-containing protein n=1 Tax=Catenulispora rubra TaxID=280293 RepID=UPI001E4935D7